MAAFFRRLPKLDPINAALVLIGCYVIVTFVDSCLYLSYAMHGGGGMLATLNPLRLVRYLLTPLGILMRLLLLSPLIVALLFPRAIENLFRKCSDGG